MGTQQSETWKEQSLRKKRAAGLFNTKEAAEWLGINPDLLYHLIYLGDVEKPARRQIGSKKRFYNLADLQKIKNQYMQN